LAQDEQQALDAVREAIEAVERRISTQQAQMDEGTRALRGVEIEIAANHQALAALREEHDTEQQRLADLESQTQAAAADLGDEREAMASQVRLSYLTGREELLKLLLNQESPSALGRMVTYYDFLNRFRSERIASVRSELEQLAALVRETRAAQTRLAELAASRESELLSLEAARLRRNQAVAELQESIGDSGRELDSLRADEQRLTDLVLELGDILTAFPAGTEEPFAALKGRLAWPARGTITGDYGKLRNGGPLRWNGVVLAANPGEAVRAVYHGRVAFSDWLPGLGLLLIVDHGDQYLSLYGYNEVLLKESGEWVQPGDVLAQVGTAGGRSGLYFELRHEGDPIDPHPWMRLPPED
jgi:septal ring factor EnvC (AmiA/AmiB activator)